MAEKHKFTKEEAKMVGDKIGIDWNKISLDEFTIGINVELEHGTEYPQSNITNDDPIMTGKIAYAHLLEFPDYYTRLDKMEEEAKGYWENKD